MQREPGTSFDEPLLQEQFCLQKTFHSEIRRLN